jgi:hypothetical protein
MHVKVVGGMVIIEYLINNYNKTPYLLKYRECFHCSNWDTIYGINAFDIK